MLPRKQSILARAFEQTYQRSIIDDSTNNDKLSSIIFGFLGGDELKAKKSDTDASKIELKHDRNLWNKIEGALFFIPRVAKNIAKLGTEFVWNAAAEGVLLGATKMRAAAERYKASRPHSYFASSVYLAMAGFAALIKAVSLLPRVIAKIGQSITSPITGMKDTYAYVAKKSGSKILGGLAATVRGLFSLALYTTIGMFALPVIAPALGAQIAGGISTAMSAIASAPVIGPVITTIGAGFTTVVTAFASFVGLSVPSAVLATSAVVAGTTMLAMPVLTALKVGLRKLFPFASRKAANVEEPKLDVNPETALETSDTDASHELDTEHTADSQNLDASAQVEGQPNTESHVVVDNEQKTSEGTIAQIPAETKTLPKSSSAKALAGLLDMSDSKVNNVLKLNPNANPAHATPVVEEFKSSSAPVSSSPSKLSPISHPAGSVFAAARAINASNLAATAPAGLSLVSNNESPRRKSMEISHPAGSVSAAADAINAAAPTGLTFVNNNASSLTSISSPSLMSPRRNSKDITHPAGSVSAAADAINLQNALEASTKKCSA